VSAIKVIAFKLELFVGIVSVNLFLVPFAMAGQSKLGSQTDNLFLVPFAMAGQSKLGSETDIANKLSKSEKAVALQGERAQANVFFPA
jgi:hypothetical protein